MIELIAAPSPLGLRPPEPGSVPGTAKAPEALREAGLYRRLGSAGAVDGGVVLPFRYRDDWRPGEGRLRNQAALLEHSGRLAERIAAVLARGSTPLVLGGDCSLLIAAGQALAPEVATGYSTSMATPTSGTLATAASAPVWPARISPRQLGCTRSRSPTSAAGGPTSTPRRNAARLPP